MQTELERKLWRMLYKSQVALAKRELADMNANRKDKKDWPGGQKWNQIGGSSKAIFFRLARSRCGIEDAEYLEILRKDIDALEIAEEEFDSAL
jgi:hypothetical protein